MEKRMKSYVDRGNKYLAKGEQKKAVDMVTKGLQYYSENILEAISPYSASDAGLLVIVLRHIADKVEKNNTGAKEFAEQMSKCLVFPDIKEVTKIKKANRE
ncbi:MAG: hypothetical protein HFH73_14240 [Lachnospiraceae bacterium]|jgi:hypothetical protein|nr:hypothetical protein [Lachnospiraceae bacterium]